ncbi:MAG: IgGFc-binding protein [Deltaproteobacteria bacterium]|nr:IgGFc-binding protein [Deltaproteobacteria bacterium]
MKRTLLALLTVLAFFAFTGCDPDSSNNQTFNNENNTTNNTTLNNNNGVCTDGQMTCSFNTIATCVNGDWEYGTVCGTQGNAPVCDPNNGSPRCVDCLPGGTICGADDDNAIHMCTADGTIGLVQEQCDASAGEECVDGNGVAACDSPCIRAANTKSYRGCEYWAVSSLNGQLDAAFDDNFAIVVDNSNSNSATITIQGGGVNTTETVAANTVRVFKMAYNQSTKTAGYDTNGSMESGIYYASSGQGAYHVTSTLPVTVYQFNPYDFEISGTNSYSNDASLLLPASVLSTNYIVMSRPNLALSDWLYGDYPISPGATTIVASKDNTHVTVDSRAYIAAGPSVGALNPGGTATYTLNQGDILQLVVSQDHGISSCPTGAGSETSSDGSLDYCNPGNDYDLTGSYISSDNPIAVWGVHSCDFIPFNYWACDHLEEMMLPLETWGNHFFVGITKQIEQGSDESNMIRIVAGEPGVQVTFTPAVNSPVTLNATGDFIEFLAPTNTHFEVDATGPIMVGKFTVGQNYWTDDSESMGDPAFGLVVPVEQYRSEYTFSTPPSITKNFVNVIAIIPSDNTGNITLDDVIIPPATFEPIGDTGYGVARMDVTDTGDNGSHKISAPDSVKFGIEVYGFANFTSYLYPGGLDLEYINPVEK